MGKNKLKKFADMNAMQCVLQYPWAELQAKGFNLRGEWNRQFFSNDNPIILELGCGKGEYTVELAKQNPRCNFIGIDIKGARMWTGAKQAENLKLKNVAFLRTDIELIQHFFAPCEVAEIWITFPDPQMAKTRKRLTSTRFLKLYDRILGSDRLINLKTDSPFLYTYTHRLLLQNNITPICNTADLYAESQPAPETLNARAVQTFYEKQWLGRGKSIKYLRWQLPAQTDSLTEPDETDIEHDDYRSYPRGITDCMPSQTAKLENKK